MAPDLIAGRYRLLQPLGRGAMSQVWLAEDEELGRQVAVKTLAPTADRARFEREARAAASLSHPNIGGLYDYGEAEGRPFMVLEYLPGGSLEDRLPTRAPLPDDETRTIASDIAAGLAHAHDRGLVHRDLKPANILFDAEGRAKIADFGIARMDGSGTLTEAGTVLGTASYISPEQAAGRSASPASDVYSFGVILFRMLTGHLPFVSDNAMELVQMHRDEPAPPVGTLRPDAPLLLASLAAAALQKDPAARPADGTALVAQLRGDVPEEAATQVLRPPVQRRRRLGIAPVVAAILLLLGAGLALALVATHGGSSGSPSSLPSLTLSTVPASSQPTQPSTSAPATTAPSTTAPSTAPATTAPTTTTHAATTVPTTTTAAAAATTTAPTTTFATTTDTTPTTTTAVTTTGP